MGNKVEEELNIMALNNTVTTKMMNYLKLKNYFKSEFAFHCKVSATSHDIYMYYNTCQLTYYPVMHLIFWLYFVVVVVMTWAMLNCCDGLHPGQSIKVSVLNSLPGYLGSLYFIYHNQNWLLIIVSIICKMVPIVTCIFKLSFLIEFICYILDFSEKEE